MTLILNNFIVNDSPNNLYIGEFLDVKSGHQSPVIVRVDVQTPTEGKGVPKRRKVKKLSMNIDVNRMFLDYLIPQWKHILTITPPIDVRKPNPYSRVSSTPIIIMSAAFSLIKSPSRLGILHY